MRKAVLCLAPTIAALILFACDDSSSSGGGGQFGFDAGQFDGFVPPTPPGDAALPDVDAGPLPVIVQVNRFEGGVADVEVVWHDANGAVLGTTKTDASGRAVSPLPAPAMATALLGKAGGERHAITWTGIAGGDLLLANANDFTGVQTGTYAVTMNQTVLGASFEYHIRVGTCDMGGWAPNAQLPNAFEIPLTGDCGSKPGAVLAASRDDGATLNGFSFAKNVTPAADGGTVNVTTGAWAAPTDVILTVANLPETGARPTPIFTEIAGSLAFPFDVSVAIPPQLDGNGQATFKVANGFADAYQYGFLDNDIRMGSYSKRLVGKRAAPAPAIGLDFKDELPEILTGDIDQTEVARPKISWTSSAPLTSTDGGSVSISWHLAGQDFPSGWTIIVPPDATNVKLPALPADAAAWAPPAPDAGLFQPIAPTVIFAESDALPGYADFRKIAGIAIPPPNKPNVDLVGEAILPVNGKLRLTDVEPAPM